VPARPSCWPWAWQRKAFELVANESGAAVTRIGLDYQIPIANAVLTTENLEQAVARQVDKGRDAARVAVEMANLMESI
jgi:6,7-dimethyl-8-ribityllumazine synthase